MSRLRRALAAALVLAPVAAGAQSIVVEPTKDAKVEIVASYAQDACDRTDVPDVPARAFRSVDGTVRLMASYSTARALTGPTLDQVRKSCGVVFRAGGRDDPSRHDDRSWISSFYTLDGRTVFALVSNEFHGQKRPDLCPSRQYTRCWRNSITAAVSTDGGATFGRPAGSFLVAALPYPYAGDVGRRTGLFAPTNMIRRDGYWYAFVWAEAYQAQRRGACLLRTDNLADPRSWRAWDGKGFTVRFADPALEPVADPAAHVCAPVAPSALIGTVRSLAIHRPTGRVVATIAATRNGPNGPVSGMYATSSADLLTWSEPRLIWAAPLSYRFGCGDREAFDYPALIDPDSRSPSFEDVGDTAYLYMSRLAIADCKVSWSRDLVRMPVQVERR